MRGLHFYLMKYSCNFLPISMSGRKHVANTVRLPFHFAKADKAGRNEKELVVTVSPEHCYFPRTEKYALYFDWRTRASIAPDMPYGFFFKRELGIIC